MDGSKWLVIIIALTFSIAPMISISTPGLIFSLISFSSIIISRSIFKISPFIFGVIWTGAYLAYLSFSPSETEINSLWTVVEILFINLVILFSHMFITRHDEFIENFRTITLPGLLHRTKPYFEAVDDIEYEMYRSRRFQVPLSVLILELGQDEIGEDFSKINEELRNQLIYQFTITKIITEIEKITRESDLILTQKSENQIVLFSPGIEMEGAKILANRISAQVQKELGLSIKFGTASFPAEALTLEELISQAEENIE